MRSRVEPGVAAPHYLYVQLAAREIELVQVGDFQLSPGRWGQRLRKVERALVIEIQPGDCVIGKRLFRLLHDARRSPPLVERDDSIPLRILHVIRKNAGAQWPGYGR